MYTNQNCVCELFSINLGVSAIIPKDDITNYVPMPWRQSAAEYEVSFKAIINSKTEAKHFSTGKSETWEKQEEYLALNRLFDCG